MDIPALIAEHWPLILGLAVTGVASGFMAGLFGIGGGAILVPALYELFGRMGAGDDVRTHLAVGTSLAVIIPTAIRSTMAHHKRGAVEWAVIRIFAPWVFLGVALGAFIADRLSGDALTLVFASLALFNGLNMVFRTPKEEGDPSRRALPSWPWRGLFGTGVGAFSSLMGVGGGTFAVLLLTYCGRGIREAVATGAAFGILIAGPATLGFAMAGADEAGLPFGSVGYISWVGFALIAPTALLAAKWGAGAAHSLDRRLLRRFFGLFLLVVSARLFGAGLT